MTRTNISFSILAALLPLLFVQHIAAQEATGAIFAASDGKGSVSLLWFPPPSRWPAGGWRLSDSTGQVLVPQINIGDAAALQSLSVEDADAIRKLPAVLAKPDATAKRTQLINIIGLRAFSEPAYARALGLAWQLTSVPSGSRGYKIEGLDGAGKPTGLQLAMPPIDASVATALPPAPAGLQVKVDERGVSLFWAAPAENRQLPVISYAIERDGGGQSAAAVTAKPVIAGVRWDSKIPLVLDRNAPPNEMLTYRVFSVDAFGRRSAGTSIRIFYPDFRALEPPSPVTAAAGVGKIVVSWPAAQKPNLAGYVLERALLYAGPYEALSAQALPPATAQYEDTTVRGGTTYYYRVRAVNSRGDLGNPSSPASAQPQNPGTPPKVDGLVADAGQTRVHLTWKPASFPVAGYFVERRALTGALTGAVAGASGVENWARLNSHVTPEPLYDDYLGLTSDAKMEYRVLAVGFDNTEGLASASVQVTIADRSVPDAPSIIGSSGADGKALLNFAPALPEAKTAQFLVLRSGSEKDLGVVLGDLLPGSARQFTDLYVSAGEQYWYRLVAVDKNGNRSDPTRPVVIRVGSPQIPAPAVLTAQYAAAPYPHVALQFQQPPAGLNVIVERQDQTQDGWIRIAGPMSAQTMTDNNVPASGNWRYRIAYVTADGKVGPASTVVTISNPAR